MGTVTNKTQARQGIHTVTGVRFADPGETIDNVRVTDKQKQAIERVRGLSFEGETEKSEAGDNGATAQGNGSAQGGSSASGNDSVTGGNGGGSAPVALESMDEAGLRAYIKEKGGADQPKNAKPAELLAFAKTLA